MSDRRFVDTNLIVRHLVQDHARNAKVASRLFEACDRGEIRLVLLPAIIAECVFVLESFYGHPRTDIAQALAALFRSPGVEPADRAVNLDALQRYRLVARHHQRPETRSAIGILASSPSSCPRSNRSEQFTKPEAVRFSAIAEPTLELHISPLCKS
jgi:predicted nucleic acid-binding protein